MQTFPRLGSAVVAAALLGTLAAFSASATVITVGADAACQFNNLPAAIALTNSNGVNDEIRLANNALYTNIALQKTDQTELTISGGWRDCVDPNFADPHTTLDGGGSPAPVLVATRGTLVLRNLLITGGAPRGPTTFGGGVSVQAGVRRVEFTNVRITGNVAGNGGGLSIVGRPGTVIAIKASNLSVDGNQSENDGGGIYAAFANGTLESLWVEGNSAGNDGGGIWMGGDTVLFNRSGRARSGIIGNSARHHGGGIALVRGAGMEMFHTRRAFAPAQISKNVAEIGGAVYLFSDRPGTDTSFTASGIIGYNNTATEEGAFAAVHTDSQSNEVVRAGMHISAAPPAFGGGGVEYCLHPAECNVFSENHAIDSNGTLKPGAMVSIRNIGPGGVGFARFWNSTLSRNLGYNLFQHFSDKVSGFAEELELKNSLVERNDVERHLYAGQGDGRLNIFSSTFANNFIPGEAISTEGFAYIRGSIFAERAPLLAFIPPNNSIFNLLVRNAAGLSTLPLIFEAEPGFEDETNLNYRLRANSPGLDREWNDALNLFDLDQLPRNIDLPAVPDFSTPRDLGCFERQL